LNTGIYNVCAQDLREIGNWVNNPASRFLGNIPAASPLFYRLPENQNGWFSVTRVKVDDQPLHIIFAQKNNSQFHNLSLPLARIKLCFTTCSLSLLSDLILKLIHRFTCASTPSINKGPLPINIHLVSQYILDLRFITVAPYSLNEKATLNIFDRIHRSLQKLSPLE